MCNAYNCNGNGLRETRKCSAVILEPWEKLGWQHILRVIPIVKFCEWRDIAKLMNGKQRGFSNRNKQPWAEACASSHLTWPQYGDSTYMSHLLSDSPPPSVTHHLTPSVWGIMHVKKCQQTAANVSRKKGLWQISVVILNKYLILI